MLVSLTVGAAGLAGLAPRITLLQRSQALQPRIQPVWPYLTHAKCVGTAIDGAAPF